MEPEDPGLRGREPRAASAPKPTLPASTGSPPRPHGSHGRARKHRSRAGDPVNGAWSPDLDPGSVLALRPTGSSSGCIGGKHRPGTACFLGAELL